MTFSSLVFIFIFLPITFLLYIVCHNTTLRNILLIAASLIFYAYGEPVAVLIMIISILCNYCFGIICSKDTHPQIGLILAIVLNIGLLFVFKYLGFFVTIINQLFNIAIPVPVISLPIGISFFTFQGLSYVIDVYRDKNMVQKKLLPVFLYISFFPQLIAGPIVKYHDIEKQLNNRVLNIDRISKGICRFIIGLGKKIIIANQVGYIADSVFNSSTSELGTLCAWIGALCYTLQIFFDFSGYSDMAIGLGCIFGFDFKENFNYPYISGSMQEFWRRWHISLSTWFKEYVYIPLGGNRCGTLRTYGNKLIVFFLTGLWHGANLTFIVWGLLHGLFLILEGLNVIPVGRKWFAPVKHIYVLLVTIITFVIFRADNISQALSYIGRMFTYCPGTYTTNIVLFSGISVFAICSFILGIVFATPLVPYIRSYLEANSRNTVYITLEFIISIVIFVVCILLLISSEYNPFIYFRF